MKNHIQRRGNTLYVFLDVPRDVREKLGRRVFRQTLKTSDPKKAEQIAPVILAAWRREIVKARGDSQHDDAAYFRQALQRASTDSQRQRVLQQIELAAWDIGAAQVEHVGDAPFSHPEAQRFHALATGTIVGMTEYLGEWLGASRATKKTQAMQRSDVNRFAARFKTVQDVNRPDVRRWVTSFMQEGELTVATMHRVLSSIRGYWRYLQSIHIAPEDQEPFLKLDLREGKRKNGRQPFEAADVVRLWHAAQKRGDEPLADLIELAMWSGARIEELCSLRCAKVTPQYFDVEDAKTEAGWRRVPVHPELKATIVRLLGKQEYLLPGLDTNKYGDRSNAIGKRFGRMKTAMGFDERFVFHSIRKTVATLLENSGVPENVAADILGHDKPTMTYGLYSGGASFAVKTAALTKLSYPGIT